MITGESVIVETHTAIGHDTHNEPIYEWVQQSVENVLVAPGPRTDIPDVARPEGVVVAYNLHFPKTFDGELEGGRIRLRDEPEPLLVIGAPRPYTLENTPTDWWMPVEVRRADG